MSIQFMVLEFEPTTFRLQVSYDSNYLDLFPRPTFFSIIYNFLKKIANPDLFFCLFSSCQHG